MATTQGLQRPIITQHREMSDLTTVPVEKPENLGKGHPGIDVVLQELRAISSRLLQVENSIDSQSNTRTSTPHRIRSVHSVVVQGIGINYVRIITTKFSWITLNLDFHCV